MTFGGPKGYAIGLIIDILCSALSGAFPSTRPRSFWNDFAHLQNLGFFMGAIDVGKFLPLSDFTDHVDRMFDEIKSSPPAPGYKKVYIPGEMEYEKEQDCRKKGIRVGAALLKDLRDLAEEYGVPFHPVRAG